VRLGPLALASVLLLGAAALAGCYKPSILPGGLRCAAGSGQCPDGFTCLSGACVLADSQDAGSSTDVAEVGADASDGPVACIVNQTPLFAGCMSRTGVCDPVCGTGCCQLEKCSAVNRPQNGGTSRAEIGCVPLKRIREINQSCSPVNRGTPERSDDCQPGLVCVDFDTTSSCLKLCRDDGDCPPGVQCEQRKLDISGTVSVSVCGVATTDCDPTAVTSICPSGTTCYLAPPAGTICDPSSGGLSTNSDCVYPRECLPTLTCPSTGMGRGTCHPVCDSTVTPAKCPPNTTCIKVGNLRYGYCD